MHTRKDEQVEAAGRWDTDGDDGGGGPEAVWCRLQVYVLKRPYVDEFLQRMGELFECVLFTASLAKVSSCLSIGPGSSVWAPQPEVLKSTHAPLSYDSASCRVSLPG